MLTPSLCCPAAVVTCRDRERLHWNSVRMLFNSIDYAIFMPGVLAHYQHESSVNTR